MCLFNIWVSIFCETLWLNSSTCLRMYLRKTSLDQDQQPIIMIRKTGHPPRIITIAASEQMECVSISSTEIWRMFSLIALMASWSAFLICVEVMCSIRLYLQMVEIGVSWLASG